LRGRGRIFVFGELVGWRGFGLSEIMVDFDVGH